MQLLSRILRPASGRRAEREIRRSGMFFAEWYLEAYPDVRATKMDPIAHYVRYGAEESRDPSPFFSTSLYVSAYSDVAQSGINPLLHYVRSGASEGRLTNPWTPLATSETDESGDVPRGAASLGPLWSLTHGKIGSDESSFAGFVICDGMPRSASTWSFNVAMEVLRQAADQRPVHGGYDECVARFLSQAPPTARYVVLKCHSLDSLGRTLVHMGRARVIYTRRNIADAVASFMQMWDGAFEEALVQIEASLELYALHRGSEDALILDYGTIMDSPEQALQRIAAHLGVELEPHAVRQIMEATSFERMRERSEALKQSGVRRDRSYGDNSLIDQDSLLHPGHIQDGTSGYGLRQLSAEQLAGIHSVLERHGIEA